MTLPDYQGIGIGMRVAEAVCDVHLAAGPSDQRDGQPSGADCPLPPFAAVAGGARAEDGLGQAARHYPRLSRLVWVGAVVSFEYLGQG